MMAICAHETDDDEKFQSDTRLVTPAVSLLLTGPLMIETSPMERDAVSCIPLRCRAEWVRHLESRCPTDDHRGEETRVCGPGTILVIPPSVEHGFIVLTDSALETFGKRKVGAYGRAA